ncbi:hypothetical protein HDZ31DRAFT_36181 [Schizophyllum fasciatum]
MTWSSPHSGWRSRATLYSETANISRANLRFAVTVSAPALTYPLLAVFAGTPSQNQGDAAPEDSGFAVDSGGNVLKLTPEDFHALTSLAHSVDAVQGRDWRVQSAFTCRPFHKLLVPQEPETEGDAQGRRPLRKTSVYAFKKDNTDLSKPVGELTRLPDTLIEFFGLAEEARVADGTEGHVLQQLRSILLDEGH